MELNNEKVIFTIQADDNKALQKAINYVNLQSNSDYEIIKFSFGEVGLATIIVSEEKIDASFLFMLGKRYEIYRKKTSINFG